METKREIIGFRIWIDGVLQTMLTLQGYKKDITSEFVQKKYWIEHGKFEERNKRKPTEDEVKELIENAEKAVNIEVVEGDVIQKEDTQSTEEDITYERNIFETPHFRLAHKSDDTYDIFYSGYNETIAPEHSVSRTDVFEKLTKVYMDCEKEEGNITYKKKLVVNAIGQLLRDEIDKDKTLKDFSEDKKEFEELVKSGN